MTDTIETRGKRASGSDKNPEPRGDGDPIQRAQEWGGGSKVPRGR